MFELFTGLLFLGIAAWLLRRYFALRTATRRLDEANRCLNAARRDGDEADAEIHLQRVRDAQIAQDRLRL